MLDAGEVACFDEFGIDEPGATDGGGDGEGEVFGGVGGIDAAGGDEADAGMGVGAAEGFEHGCAAGGLGGEEFEQLEIHGEGAFDLAWGHDAGDHGELEGMGLFDDGGVKARGDAEGDAEIFELGEDLGVEDGAGTDGHFGEFVADGANGRERAIGAEGDFDMGEIGFEEGLGEGEGSGEVGNDGHRDQAGGFDGGEVHDFSFFKDKLSLQFYCLGKLFGSQRKSMEERDSHILSGMFDFSILREIRKREGLTLDEVAHRSGLSIAVISRLERNQTTAELVTLYKLARVFGMSATDLLAVSESRMAHQKVEESYRSDGFAFRVIRYANHACFEAVAKAGSKISKPEIHYDDHETCWVIEGRVRVQLPHEAVELSAGESLQFDAIQEHSYEALEDSRLVLVHVKKRKRY